MLGAALIGLAGGVVAGLLGVGGGVLFVPGLALFLGLHQVVAEATSLVAIVPVAVAGTWRQRSYGNVRFSDALLIGVLSAGGALAGVAAANLLAERVLRIAFAVVMLIAAAQLVLRSRSSEAEPAKAGPVAE